MSVFSVMTWNVENLFPPNPADKDNTARPPDLDTYFRKLEYLRLIIEEGLKPDNDSPTVIALQEVGDIAAVQGQVYNPIKDLQSRLGGAYPHAYTGIPDGRGIRVALLSKLPLTGVQNWVDFPFGLFKFSVMQGMSADTEVTRMGRGAVKATVEVEKGLRVHLVTTHLKSKLVTYPPPYGKFPLWNPPNEYERTRELGFASLRRIAEAAAVRSRILDLITSNDDPLVLMGDLNDEQQAASTAMLYGEWEPIVDSAPKPGDKIKFTRKILSANKKIDDTRLYNLADVIQPERRYSRINDGRKELIDHILVTRDLALATTRVDSLVANLESIGVNRDARQKEVIPDHAPVYAIFEVSAPKK